MTYDSGPETREHIAQVARRLHQVCIELRERGIRHDMSKLGREEKPVFDVVTPKLKGLVYGTDEYRASLKDLGPALTHHYRENTHHPEHFPNGVFGMDLLDVLEMYCDWAAASLRTKDGDVSKGLEINIQRFGITGPLADILRNTAKRHGGFSGYEGHRLMRADETKAYDEWSYDWDYTSGGLEVMRKPKQNAPLPRFEGERAAD
jgi:hypothetical protein